MILHGRPARPSPRLHVFRDNLWEAEASTVTSLPRFRASVAVPVACAGLLFDTGDVFFDETAWWRWMARQLSRVRPRWHYADLCRVWRNEYRSEVNCGCREYWNAVECLLQSVGLSAAQTDEMVRAGRPVQRRFGETTRLLPEVQATLQYLAHTGMPLGVLSHSPCSGQDAAERLHELGIGSCFQVVVSSADLGPAAMDGWGYADMAHALGAVAEEVGDGGPRCG